MQAILLRWAGKLRGLATGPGNSKLEMPRMKTESEVLCHSFCRDFVCVNVVEEGRSSACWRDNKIFPPWSLLSSRRSDVIARDVGRRARILHVISKPLPRFSRNLRLDYGLHVRSSSIEKIVMLWIYVGPLKSSLSFYSIRGFFVIRLSIQA